MKTSDIKNLLIVEIVAPSEIDNSLSEEERNEIYNRYKISNDYRYIFEPIKDESLKNKYIELFDKLDNPDS